MFICDFQVWLRKEDGSKTKLYIRQLQKGKYRIRKSWNPTYQGQHFDLGYIESVEFQSILRQIVSACSNTCYMCNVFDAYYTRLDMTCCFDNSDFWGWQFLNPSYCRKKFGMSTCSCTKAKKSWPMYPDP